MPPLWYSISCFMKLAVILDRDLNTVFLSSLVAKFWRRWERGFPTDDSSLIHTHWWWCMSELSSSHRCVIIILFVFLLSEVSKRWVDMYKTYVRRYRHVSDMLKYISLLSPPPPPRSSQSVLKSTGKFGSATEISARCGRCGARCVSLLKELRVLYVWLFMYWRKLKGFSWYFSWLHDGAGGVLAVLLVAMVRSSTSVPPPPAGW